MIYAQVGSMCNAHREEFDKVLGPNDARRFTVDEGLFGGAPRKRFFWTNAPVAPVEAATVAAAQRSLVDVLREAGSRAVPVFPAQRLATIVTCAARGRVAGSLEDPRPADYERVKATTKTGNWVQLSSSCDIIRLLNPREMAIALNLPANYVSDLNCTDSKARTILGSAFGVKSIAHVLACLAGIGEA